MVVGRRGGGPLARDTVSPVRIREVALMVQHRIRRLPEFYFHRRGG
jgi:hypothetical protein